MGAIILNLAFTLVQTAIKPIQTLSLNKNGRRKILMSGQFRNHGESYEYTLRIWNEWLIHTAARGWLWPDQYEKGYTLSGLGGRRPWRAKDKTVITCYMNFILPHWLTIWTVVGFSKAARLNPDGLKPIIPFSLSDPGRSCLNDFNIVEQSSCFFYNVCIYKW